jgi:hypothetical protein
LGDPALSNISVLGVDPGAMSSDLLRNNTWMTSSMIKYGLVVLAPISEYFQPNGSYRTTSKSAADVLRACFDTETLGEHPQALYLNGTEEKETSAESRDPAKRKMLWTDSVRYVDLKEGETVLSGWKWR